jgi:hypothetical protein
MGAAVERRRQEGKKFLTESPAAEPGEHETWIITVEFEDAAGAMRQGTAEVSKPRGRQVHEVGDQVPILYDPARPWDLRLPTFLNWFGPLVVGALGTVFLTVGLLLWGVLSR